MRYWLGIYLGLIATITLVACLTAWAISAATQRIKERRKRYGP